MGFILKTIISTGVFLLAEAGIKKLSSVFTGEKKESNAYAAAITELRNEGGADGSDAKLTGAALIYDKVESQGGNPDDFWAGLSEEDRSLLEFSPQRAKEQLQITRFGGISSLLLFIAAAVAAGVGAKRGIPIITKTLSKLAIARAAGKKAADLMAIIEEGKIEGLAKVWTPAKWATLFGATGWLTTSMVNQLNDVGLWGRINLQNAESDYNKILDRQNKLSAGGADGATTRTPRQPVTRITMAKVAKPVVFSGVIFSQKIKHMDAFIRNREDKISNTQELTTDAQNELNKWLATLPGRLGYTIQVQNQPFDENGFVQAGTWITMSILYTGISGRKLPLDTVLLGQIDPVVYTPKTQDTLTIQHEIPKLLTAEEVAEVQFPSEGVKVVDKTGNVVPSLFGQPTGGAAGSPVAQPSAQTVPPVFPGVSVPADTLKSIFRLEEDDDKMFRQVGDTVYSFDITKLLTQDERRAAGNVGEQRIKAKPRLKEITRIDFDSLQKRSTFDIWTRGGPVGITGEPKSSGVDTLDEFLRLGGAAVATGKFPRTVTVNVDTLNVRAQPTSQSALAGSQKLFRGDTFVAVDSVAGELVTGENRWWKSQFGNWVWAGGTTEKP